MATESDAKLNEMIKVKIKDVKESIDKETGEKTFSITIPEEKIGNKTTLIRENEIIGIVKTLDLDNLNLRKDKWIFRRNAADVSVEVPQAFRFQTPQANRLKCRTLESVFHSISGYIFISILQINFLFSKYFFMGM